MATNINACDTASSFAILGTSRISTDKGTNLYSFYSDISEIVLKNEKFALDNADA